MNHPSLLACLLLLLPYTLTANQSGKYTIIKIVDEETDRGVPLVTLKTVNDRQYVTDSQGVVAFHEPGLMNQQVFFHITSHGYEFPKDGFGYRGTKVTTKPGTTVTLKIHRVNVAERLYRVTGQGIYRDSQLANLPIPIKDDVPGNVLGCDSVLAEAMGDYIYWFWGDTNRAAYPLGNFHASGARSRRLNTGGLDPNKGVDLEYFTNEQGFAKETARLPGDGLTWLDCLMKTYEADGSRRLFAVYMKVKPPLQVYQRGIAEFNLETQQWEHRVTFPESQRVIPQGHPLRYREPDGEIDYFYFAGGMPYIRVPANAKDLLNPRSYEAYTCLANSTGSSYRVGRFDNGQLGYRWTTLAPAMNDTIANKLIADKKIKPHEAANSLIDVDSGDLIRTQHGSVYYNELKRRYVLIVSQIRGTSMLGEIWYAEAPEPIGPWKYARKIVSHDNYSFYNPKQHPFLSGDGGRTIFFEGTYTTMFSGNETPTPGYNYNQIMYKLNTQDPRLNLPLPVTLARRVNRGTYRWTLGRLRDGYVGTPLFYALEREGDGLREITIGSERMWVAIEPGPQRVALYEWENADGNVVVRLEGEAGPNGYQRKDLKLGYVWRK